MTSWLYSSYNILLYNSSIRSATRQRCILLKSIPVSRYKTLVSELYMSFQPLSGRGCNIDVSLFSGFTEQLSSSSHEPYSVSAASQPDAQHTVIDPDILKTW